MKKFLITALALVAGVSMAMAGMGISWGDGGGWMVEFGGDINSGPGVADNNAVLWQLIYAGEDNAANDIDLAGKNYLSGDDELLADRNIPAGGGSAADGTSWDGWLMQQSGNTLYEDLSFDGKGSYVYQRIFQGTPAAGSYYYETDLFAFNSGYAGGGQASDLFYYDPNTSGLAVDKQIPGEPPEPPQIPEPATMSLLGLGALAMVLRRKLSK
ncbi:MAG: PEP-CTERM sorting domain-containing protein [Kiritimatiellae bacterium]|nr:PEP-CTERM sorting domain-containing protein [Kiritimatiellia bacterium]